MALDEKDVETVKSLIGEANKPITDLLNAQKATQHELTKNVGVLADTLKNAPPAKEADKKTDDKSQSLTDESVTKLVTDAIAADRKAQAEAATKSAGIQSAKDKIITDKLGGDKDFAAYLPDTDDAAALAAAADTLAAKLTPKANVPGITTDGGTASARQPVDMSKMSPQQLAVMGLQQSKAATR